MKEHPVKICLHFVGRLGHLSYFNILLCTLTLAEVTLGSVKVLEHILGIMSTE